MPAVKEGSLPPVLTMAALEDLAIEAGGQFAAGLKRFALQEKERLEAERLKLETAVAQLEEARRQVEEQRQQLEEERQQLDGENASRSRQASVSWQDDVDRECEFVVPEPPSPQTSEDVVHLNVGGEVRLSVLRATLTQCEGSKLAEAFNGRGAALPQDVDGNAFVNFAPQIFVPLVDHLRIRYTQGPGIAPPAALPDPTLDENFVAMCRHFGILDWVYQQQPVEFQVTIGEYNYSVLPPQPPTMGQSLSEMRGLTVTVPRGWQVLSAGADNFDRAILELTRQGWGAAELVVAKAHGIGYWGYRTRLSQRGMYGSKVEEHFPWFDSISEGGRKVRFASAGYRLVIVSSAKEAH